MSKPTINDANILLAAFTRTTGVKSHNGVVDAERTFFLQWTAVFCTFLNTASEINKPCKSFPSARRPLCLRAQRLDNYSTYSTTSYSSGDYQFMICSVTVQIIVCSYVSVACTPALCIGRQCNMARHRRNPRRRRNQRFHGHPPRRPKSPSPSFRPRRRLHSSALERNRWFQCSLAGPALQQRRWPPSSGAVSAATSRGCTACVCATTSRGRTACEE